MKRYKTLVKKEQEYALIRKVIGESPVDKLDGIEKWLKEKLESIGYKRFSREEKRQILNLLEFIQGRKNSHNKG